MRPSLRLLALGIVTSMAGATGVQAATYNAFEAFPTGMPTVGGQFQFGYATALGGALTLFNSYGTNGSSQWVSLNGGEPAVGRNPGATTLTLGTLRAEPGMLVMHPGAAGQYAVVRFTAPTAGLYDIDASFYGLDTAGTSTDVHILVDGISIFTGAVNSAYVSGPGAGSTADLQRSLLANQNVDFVVGYGVNQTYFYDSTGMTAVLSVADPAPTEPGTPVPLPGGLALLGAGLLGLGAVRRASR